MAERKWTENNVSDDANMWDKEAPLMGRLVKIEADVGPNHSKLYTVKRDNGEEVKLWGSTVIDDRFLGIPEGAYVKVNYEGLKKSKAGKDYHSYKVFVDLDDVAEVKKDQEPELTEADMDSDISLDSIPF